MVKEQTSKRELKLTHLLWVILIAVLMAGVSAGVLKNQQSTNTKEIEKKVGKDVFIMHNEQQMMQFKDIKESLKRIEEK